jgi:hypothetical protein
MSVIDVDCIGDNDITGMRIHFNCEDLPL